MNDLPTTRLPVTHPNGKYEVIVGRNLLPDVVNLADIEGPVAIVTDSNVGPLYAQQCSEASCVVTIPAGEKHKTLGTVQIIYDQLLAAGVDRKWTLVALGGGVVGDVAGFVAATYMRGINLVQCPTSLLAMVDASVGGKTGVDLPQGKNLVGAFKQPEAVIVDLATLQTLPQEEYAAGMAEVMKAGIIAAPEILEILESSEAGFEVEDPTLATLVTEAIRVKRDIVQEDPFEHGRRAVLNLGHTFGHAVEQVSNYEIRHGEAVAMGIVAACHLSSSLSFCSPSLQNRVESLLARLHLPARIPANLPPQTLYQAMGSDKKKTAGKLRFVLLRGVGEVFITGDVPESSVMSSLASLGAGRQLAEKRN